MWDGPHVGKVRSRDPPWYPLTLGMTHAASSVLELTGNSILATAYTHHCVIVGQKGQLRLQRDIKRRMCKRCHGLLLPSKTAKIMIMGPEKQKRLEFICQVCSSKKSFLLEKKNKEKKKAALEK